MKPTSWFRTAPERKAPRHIQEMYIQAAKEKRERRAKKWAKIARKP